MEDRFYPKDEWNRLTQEQRNKVTEMARERKKRAGDSAYSKCETATAGNSDRDDIENIEYVLSPALFFLSLAISVTLSCYSCVNLFHSSYG